MCSPRQSLLMFLSLRMRQVIGFVGVQGQTQLALVRPQMIPHEVRILGEINRFERELFEPFLPFPFRLLCRRDSTTSEFAAHAVLPINAPQQAGAGGQSQVQWKLGWGGGG